MDGSLIIGDGQGLLYTYDGRNKETVSRLRIGRINDLEPYQNGHLVCSTSGLYLYRGGKLKKLGQIDISAHRLLLDGGHLYVLADEGIYELLGEQLVEKTERGDPYSSSAYFDWIRIDGQVYLLGKHFLRNLNNPQDTLFSQKRPINAVLYTDGDLLIGDNEGFYTIKQGKKRQVLLDGSTLTDPVNSLFAPNKKSWFIGQSLKGYAWDKESYLLDIVLDPVSSRSQSIEDVQHDRWGNVWVAQGKVLHCYKKSSTKQQPVLLIQSILQGGRPLDLNEEPFRFRKEENSFSIYYSAIQLNGGETKTEYSVDGGKNWTLADKNVIGLRELVPGKYELQVRSSVDEKYYSYSSIYTIVIADQSVPVWLQSLLGLGIGALLLSFFLLWRSKENQGKLELEKKKLIAENKALRQSQKVLQLQMNPHFIFNTINSINGLLAKNDSPKARHYLSSFSKLMRSTLEQSRAEWVKIEDEVNYLEQYLSLEQMCRNNSFDYSITKGADLFDEDLSTLPMIIQPFIENAIIHGVSDMSSGGTIQVSFELLDLVLHVQILDNGKGYQEDQSNKNHESVALKVVHDRLSAFKARGAKFEILNRKDVEDKRGTQVDIYLPIR